MTTVDASDVSYTLSGLQGTPQTVQSKLDRIIFAGDLGILPGSVDMSEALQSAINALSVNTASKAAAIIVFGPGSYMFWGVELAAGVTLRASSYRPGHRAAQDVLFIPPLAPSPGWMISSPSSPTNNFGIEGIAFVGTSCTTAAGFGALKINAGVTRSLQSNFFNFWGEQGLLVTSGNVDAIKHNLAYNCVMARTRTAYIGAFELTETDSYIEENEVGTSSAQTGVLSNGEPYLCGLFLSGGGNNFCFKNVCETSDIGCVDNSYYSRHVGCRYELNLANGLISMDGGQAYVNPYFRNNSRIGTGLYSDLKIETNYKPARMIVLPVFEYDTGEALPSYNIEDTVSIGTMTCYVGRRPPLTSFAWPNQQWNEQQPPQVPVFNGQNMVRNASMQGATVGTPGTLPTYWRVAQAGGLTFDVEALGYENDLPYIDFHVHGMATSTYFEIDLEVVGSIPAAFNQVWTASAYVKLVSGAFAGLVSVGIGEYASATSYLTAGASSGHPTLDDLGNQRLVYTRSLTSPTVAFVRPYLQGQLFTGASTDATLRIGLPQIEPRGAPGIPIATTGTAVALF